MSLHDMMHSGSAAAALGQFLRKLSDRHANRTVTQIMEELKKIAGSQAARGEQIFLNMIHMQRQLIFNHLSRAVEEMGPLFSDFPKIQKMLQIFVQGDPSTQDGLTKLASHIMQLTLQLFAFELGRLHNENQLNADSLKKLLYGTAGMELVVRQVIQPLISKNL
ncbi:MAG: hypothetical protein KKD30_09850 [Gammaproteobacteria bacterium]|nr:hypothetical protein [Gammaproteobacteria bacterium]MBU0883224.1 hypothetical protein [Gammaproteobacteria bacterium]MBU1860247.1 hypothetical protein [Gammaproteobacteria bacterium]